MRLSRHNRGQPDMAQSSDAQDAVTLVRCNFAEFMFFQVAV